MLSRVVKELRNTGCSKAPPHTGQIGLSGPQNRGRGENYKENVKSLGGWAYWKLAKRKKKKNSGYGKRRKLSIAMAHVTEGGVRNG